MNALDRLRAGEMAGATRLDLQLGLHEVPPEVLTLAPTLEVLNLSGNRLATLPAWLPQLKRLKVIFCSDNPFHRLPEVLGECPALEMIGFKACRLAEVPASALPPTLRWLILTDNQIEHLPDVFDRFPHLQKLMLAGNRLRQLPPTLKACTRLELLRIACNRLTELPAWLLTLPGLAWLACAGNPFCDGQVTPGNVDTVPWPTLSLQHTLGEGASGTVYQARLPTGDAVAVKCFKGHRTSDGSPDDETAACLHAGRHPNLVPLRGQLTDHPSGLPGLVMELIDPAYRVLAGPPSLHSCTRDTYAPGLSLTLDVARQLLTGIASAARHLHERGVMHGDLYGHNVLYRQEGHALLGDFGAACRYVPDSGQVARALEAIEVRAFGLLLEEVATRCQAAPGHWAALSLACRQPEPTARPRFSEIEQRLRAA
jgi:hypothetical protein